MMRNFMHQFIALITLCFVFTANVNAENEEPAIRSVMLAYEQAWSEHDAKAVASYYFAPAIRFSKTGPSVRATIKDQELFLKDYLAVWLPEATTTVSGRRSTFIKWMNAQPLPAALPYVTKKMDL